MFVSGMFARYASRAVAVTIGMAFAVAALTAVPSDGQEPPDKVAQTPLPEIPYLHAWQASPHANVGSRSFAHWDKDGAVPVACATCHSGPGFRDFLGADGSTPGKVDRPAPVRAVVDCVTCHNDKSRQLTNVTFPSGLTVGNLGRDAVCTVCHQGRQSTPDVNRAVAGMEPDQVSDKLRFINVHYAVAAASMWGSAAKGGFEYAGKSYHGRSRHTPAFSTCTQCHDAHRLTVNVQACTSCHEGERMSDIRTSETDYDGDGNTTEGIAAEISALHGALREAIKNYARTVAGAPIAYHAGNHPYFFNDLNDNSVADAEEAVRTNAYGNWTPRLLKAAYNYQFIAKDPGIYAHNPVYALQLLYDSLESLSEKAPVDLTGLTRP